MKDIKPRIDEGVPWCDAGCPQAIMGPPPTTLIKCHLDKERRYSNWHCPHAVKRMAVENEAWRCGKLIIDVGGTLTGENIPMYVLGSHKNGRPMMAHKMDEIDAAVDALMGEE